MKVSVEIASGPVDLCSATPAAALISLARAQATSKIFKALGDPTRVRLLGIIAGSRTGEACICDLVDPLGLSQPTVSHHMKQLVDAGLVTREQRGKWAYFRMVPTAWDDITGPLADLLREGSH